ncbi:MAG: hypothetical protein V1911_00830 [Candidatus Micrarchaeota archaeon]
MTAMIGKGAVVFLISIVSWFVGAILAYNAVTVQQALPAELFILSGVTSAILMSAIVFGFGFMFFGLSSPLIMFFLGIEQGNNGLLTSFTAGMGLTAASAFLMSFASVYLGMALFDDLTNKESQFKPAMKFSAVLIAIAVAIAVAVDLKLV